MSGTPPSGPALAIEATLADQFAQVCQIYGIPAKYGRLYALLFLSPRPLSLSELAARSTIAKSTTSTAMRSLERYRLVRRAARGSDRQDYYEVVADIAQVMRDWVRMFLAPELEVGAQLVERFQAGITTLADAAGYDASEVAVLEQRAALMRRSLRDGEQLVATLLAIFEGEGGTKS